MPPTVLQILGTMDCERGRQIVSNFFRGILKSDIEARRDRPDGNPTARNLRLSPSFQNHGRMFGATEERFRVKSRTSDSIRHASYVWICFRFTAADQRKSNGGKTMAESKKCGNPACTCIPPEKETFCSPHCEALRGSVEIVCQCGHNHCGGSQSHAASTTIA